VKFSVTYGADRQGKALTSWLILIGAALLAAAGLGRWYQRQQNATLAQPEEPFSVDQDELPLPNLTANFAGEHKSTTPWGEPTEPLSEQTSTSWGELELIIDGFSGDSGICLIALYQNSASFNQTDQAWRLIRLPVDQPQLRYVVEQVPVGQLGIAAFHDTNSNDQLDKNRLGIPTERFGFSNNPRRLMGVPTFQQVAIQVHAGERRQVPIQLRSLLP
jgi:uncharacterized protein (DUF2141 family)